MRHVLIDDGKTGTMQPCPDCHSWLAHCRLNHLEQMTTLAHITGGGPAAALRRLGENILADPFGFFFVWGGVGSAKTLLLHALTAGFCRAGRQAVYYHAADLADGLYKDIQSDDSDNMAFYRRVPVLVIDELDKYNFTDWSRKKLQALLDDRYRNMTTHMTIFAANRDPMEEDAQLKDSSGKILRVTTAWLPDDIKSRLGDGRFVRTVDGREYPGVYHIKAPDARPTLRRQRGATP